MTNLLLKIGDNALQILGALFLALLMYGIVTNLYRAGREAEQIPRCLEQTTPETTETVDYPCCVGVTERVIPTLELTPDLKFGQVVYLNDDFYDNIKVVVIARCEPGVYMVSTLQGPVVKSLKIHANITRERESNE